MSLKTLVRGSALALFLSVFTYLPALAEAVPRSINEIIALSLKNSAGLAALEKDAEAKKSLAVQAGTLGNPTLELQGSTGSLTGSPDERTASIGVNQEFPLYGKLGLRREAALREAESLQHQRNNAARLLREETATMILDYLLAAKRQELAADLVKLNRELLSIAGERFRAGDIPELDFNLAKVELTRGESRLLAVEREVVPLRIKIASLTGLDESDIKLSNALAAPLVSPTPQDFVRQALTSRPDLLALASERDKAETESRLAKAEALPGITAGLFVQWERGSTELGDMSSTGNDTQLGLRLSMPIPVFDRNSGGRSSAEARQYAANSRLVALERSITAEVESAISRLSSSERILALLEQGIIPQLTENLNLTQNAYRLGEVGILSVIDEQKKFFEVSDGYLSALYSRRVALIKLESAAAINLTGGVQ